MVLCSDGVANVGMTGPEGIAARIAEEGRKGIHLVTVGYGMGNYNDHLMEQLADQGDGFYRYVDTYEEAQHLYVDELTTLLTPVADDARTQVAFDPEPWRRTASSATRTGRWTTSPSRTSPPTPASSGPVTGRPRCTRCGSPRGSSPAPDRHGEGAVEDAGQRGAGGRERAALRRRAGERRVRLLGLATAAADLAALVKGYGVEDRPTSLEDVRSRADGAGDARRSGRGRAGGARWAAGVPGSRDSCLLEFTDRMVL